MGDLILVAFDLEDLSPREGTLHTGHGTKWDVKGVRESSLHRLCGGAIDRSLLDPYEKSTAVLTAHTRL